MKKSQISMAMNIEGIKQKCNSSEKVYNQIGEASIHSLFKSIKNAAKIVSKLLLLLLFDSRNLTFK